MYEQVQPRQLNNSNRSISQKNRDKVLNGRVVFYWADATTIFESSYQFINWNAQLFLKLIL